MVREIVNEDFDGLMELYTQLHNNPFPQKTQEIIDLCDEKITIKMSGRAESLNAAAAASITMWELVK